MGIKFKILLMVLLCICINKPIYTNSSEVKYEYDQEGKLIQTTKNNFITMYEYDKEGNLINVGESKELEIKNINVSINDIGLSRGKNIRVIIQGIYVNNNPINESTLNKAIWSCDSQKLKFSSKIGKSIEISMDESDWLAWDEKEAIIINVELNGHIRKIEIKKKIEIESLEIVANKTTLTYGENISFKVSGKYNNGKVIEDNILDKAIWTSTSDYLKFATNKGKQVVGTYNYENKAVPTPPGFSEFYVHVQVNGVQESLRLLGRITPPGQTNTIKEIKITPSKTIIKSNEVVTLSVTGTYVDGRPIGDIDLKNTRWSSNSSQFKFYDAVGKSVQGIYSTSKGAPPPPIGPPGIKEIYITGELNGITSTVIIKVEVR